MEYIFLRCSSICTSGKYWKSNEFGHGKGHREVAYCLLCEKKFESMVTICVPRFRPKRERERKARRFYPYKVIVCIIHIDRSNRSCCRFAMPSFPFHPSPTHKELECSPLAMAKLWSYRCLYPRVSRDTAREKPRGYHPLGDWSRSSIIGGNAS